MSIQFVTIFNREPDRSREPYYRLDMFRKSAERQGIAPVVLGLNQPWGGLMTKPRRLREWLRAGNCTTDLLVVTDAFDIIFTTPAEEIEKRYRELWTSEQVVFNAEKGIFPRGELAHKFEEVPGPWKYLNSGFMLGTPAMILAMLEAMWLDDVHDDWRSPDELHGGPGTMINTNDQGHFQAAYAMQVVPIVLDHECVLCQSLSGCTIEEFDLTRSRILNVEKQATPLVFHFNGGSKNDLMPLFLAKWGLE